MSIPPSDARFAVGDSGATYFRLSYGIRFTRVSAASWHDGPWPFTVPAGSLSCGTPAPPDEITFLAGGHSYALNRAAQTHHYYRDVAFIQRRAANGTRVGLSRMIRLGLRLCPGRGSGP